VRHGLALVAAGADAVDVGGESTRPGAARVPEQEELRRTVEVVRSLAGHGVPVSIDTMRASVAAAALEAGAVMVNDVSGGAADPGMAAVVAAAGCPFVVMHWRGHSEQMASRAVYRDIVREVRDELCARVDTLVSAGVDPARLVLDPGIGFAKEAAHGWALLAHLDALDALGFPLLVGASRKRFLGHLLAADDGTPRPVEQRDGRLARGRRPAGSPRRVGGPRPHRPPHRRRGPGGCGLASCARRRTRAGSDVMSSYLGDYGGPVDQVAVRGIRGRGTHGVLAHEKRDGQDFSVDVVLHVPTVRAGRSDDLADAVDYSSWRPPLTGS
jgi:dihydropteroate synthase